MCACPQDQIYNCWVYALLTIRSDSATVKGGLYITCIFHAFSLGQMSVDDVEVLCCGGMGWVPPSDTGGLVDRYAVRFFTGDSMETTTPSERELQRIFDNPEKRFTKANNLPSDCSTVLRAQVYYHNNHNMAQHAFTYISNKLAFVRKL